MEIVKIGNPILRIHCRPVTEVDHDLIEEMFQTMYKHFGVGLAAPQVNVDQQIFVIDTNLYLVRPTDALGTDNKSGRKIFINPIILKSSGLIERSEESCLSIPDISVMVPRSYKIEIHYFDENMEEHTEVFTGLISRVIQHEYDHLFGKLIVDYQNIT